MEAGFDCQEQGGNLDLIRGNWVEGNYNYAAAKSPLEKLIAPLSEFPDLLPVRGPVVEGRFSEARECIETLKGQGEDRKAAIAAADLSRAQKAWWSYLDYEGTLIPLDKIIGQCPEPILLSVLSIVLLPLLRKAGGEALSG